MRAVELYQWNAKLGQSLYIYLQGWEIRLRSKLNGFLVWKYIANWPYDERAPRQMNASDRRRLQEARQRQEMQRSVQAAPTSAIVADLSAGFWVSQLSGSYRIPYVWRHNLPRVFPHDRVLDAKDAWAICNDLLILRNRVAHHEPILQLPLDRRMRDLKRVVAAMCPATQAYCEASCSFDAVWRARP
ncbi:hypothetical protein ASG48_17315 [Aurantimonas sp. Leaf443]|nr:hypothetical protein ASG48_17315 [Aurantimonas sp. Leaf443]